MKSLISVIVPIYNVEKYLNECLLSIQNQTYPLLEVILINDGSTDRSAEIAQHFVTSDRRFHLIQQNNAGQSAARNRGLDRASGEYISFVDADDFIAPDFYETLIHDIQTADILQIGYTRVNQDSQIISKHTPHCFFQYTTPWSRLFRKDFIKKNHLRFEEGQIYEDILFSIDAWKSQAQHISTGYTGYYYRSNPTSTTATKHDTKPLFALIAQKKKGCTLWQRAIILYTIVRLRLHFLLNR